MGTKRQMARPAGGKQSNGGTGRHGGSLRARAAPGAPAAGQRTAVRPEFRGEGPVRRRRQHHDLRQSRLGEHPCGGERDRSGGDRAVAGGRPAGRQDQDGGTRLRPDRRERLAGHPGQSARAGPVSRRLELRLGRRGGRRTGRLRARLRHRRLGAHPGKLLRPVRHPPEPRRGQPGRRLPAGTELRHLRLVHPQRGVAGRRRRGAAAWRPPGGGRPAAAGRGGLGQRAAGGRRGAAPGAGATRAVARQGGRHPAGSRGDRQHLRPLPHGAGGGGLGLSRRLGRDDEAALRPRHRRALRRRQGDRRRGRRTRPGVPARAAGAGPAAAGRRRRAGLSDQPLPGAAAHQPAWPSRMRSGRRPSA